MQTRLPKSVGAGLVPARSVAGGIINMDRQDEQDREQKTDLRFEISNLKFQI
jgi:hypothetical protein